MTFHRQLQFGQAGESAIAHWFRNRGFNVLPVYEKIVDTGKGPQLFLSGGESLIAPDMLVFKPGCMYWIEAKHKTAFTWYRVGGRWTTGIDLRHYLDYLKVDDNTEFDVWLLFLHRGGKAKDNPFEDSPAGLYGNTLEYLRHHEDHRSDNWGKSGMVYWGIQDLRKIAALEEVEVTELLQQSISLVTEE